MKVDLSYFIHFTRSRPLFLLGLLIVTIGLIAAAVPNLLAPYPPEQADITKILLPPSSDHWFGTDINGMDVFSRVVWAPRVDLVIAVFSVAVALGIGTIVGVWIGFYEGRIGRLGPLSEIVMRALDILQAFPIFVLALAIMAVLGRSINNVILVLVVLQAPIFVRLTRSAALSVRDKPYVEAARCSGFGDRRLIFRHVLPNSLSPALINASVLTGGAILIASGLSFIGAGVPAPTPEWGYMVASGASNLITGRWWPAIFPGIALGLTVLGFALVGDGLREFLDPTKRT